MAADTKQGTEFGEDATDGGSIYSANISGILFQFPFYAGIMGKMIQTGLGNELALWMATNATIDNYPLMAFFSGGFVNFAIPSAGGEFAVIGQPRFSGSSDRLSKEILGTGKIADNQNLKY